MDELTEGEPSYDVRILMGRRDDPMMTIYGRQLIELISTTKTENHKPLLLCLSLKDESKATFNSIMQIIRENKVW